MDYVVVCSSQNLLCADVNGLQRSATCPSQCRCWHVSMEAALERPSHMLPSCTWPPTFWSVLTTSLSQDKHHLAVLLCNVCQRDFGRGGLQICWQASIFIKKMQRALLEMALKEFLPIGLLWTHSSWKKSYSQKSCTQSGHRCHNTVTTSLRNNLTWFLSIKRFDEFPMSNWLHVFNSGISKDGCIDLVKESFGVDFPFSYKWNEANFCIMSDLGHACWRMEKEFSLWLSLDCAIFSLFACKHSVG